MKNKIEISVEAYMKVVYDFGNFKSKFHLKVDRDWWTKYVNARRDFEILHDQLIKKVRK